jgi:hypothetical protein
MTSDVAAYSRTRFTTVWGGSGIVVASVLSILLPYATIWYPAAPVLSATSVAVAPIILAVAVYVLAFGIRAETGVVGDSRSGKIAVVVFGAALILKSLIRLFLLVFPPHLTDRSVDMPGYIQLGLSTVALACLIIAVVATVRHGTLNVGLRWGLIIVTAWTVLAAALWFIPIAFVLYFAIDAQTIGILLQAILGAAFALHGQAPALRRRAAIINERW